MPRQTPASGPQRRRSTARRFSAAGSIDIYQDGAETVEALVERIRSNVANPSTMMVAAPPVRAGLKRLFESGGGGRWRPTSDKATKEKAAKGLRTEPMRATDRLYNALTEPGAAGGYAKISRRGERSSSLTIGSNLPEGALQRRYGRDASLLDDQTRLEVTEALVRAVFQ